MKKMLWSLLLLPVAHIAVADETTLCKLNNSERTIELISSGQGCEVRYTKGGETKTLWSSPRAEYCAPHAAEFIEKQRGWGYSCAAITSTGDTTAAQ
jgi:hypothetical protein